jgi:hypothetical protein
LHWIVRVRVPHREHQQVCHACSGSAAPGACVISLRVNQRHIVLLERGVDSAVQRAAPLPPLLLVPIHPTTSAMQGVLGRTALESVLRTMGVLAAGEKLPTALPEVRQATALLTRPPVPHAPGSPDGPHSLYACLDVSLGCGLAGVLHIGGPLLSEELCTQTSRLSRWRRASRCCGPTMAMTSAGSTLARVSAWAAVLGRGTRADPHLRRPRVLGPSLYGTS